MAKTNKEIARTLSEEMAEAFDYGWVSSQKGEVMEQHTYLEDAGLSVKRYDVVKDIVIRDENDGDAVVVTQQDLPALVEFLSRFL